MFSILYTEMIITELEDLQGFTAGWYKINLRNADERVLISVSGGKLKILKHEKKKKDWIQLLAKGSVQIVYYVSVMSKSIRCKNVIMLVDDGVVVL